MRSEDTIKAAKERLAKIGVPKHVASVRKVPSCVEVRVLVGNDVRRVELRQGITPTELEQKLAIIENRWRDWKTYDGHQVTLEEAIAAAVKG